MGWESRRRGGRYYTRTRRVGGKVVREYVGTGPAAEQAAAADEARRRQAELDRAAEQELEAVMQELDEVADLYFRAAMILAGYRQHDRGQWRKRREKRPE